MEVYSYDRKRIRYKVMETIFGNALNKAIRTSNIDTNTQSAREWLRSKAQSIRSINPSAVINKSNERGTAYETVGQMFLFAYDPKHKTTLPYYDRFPLVFPIESYGDGFLGINMHYLPLPFRAKLMDSLYDNINNNKMDMSTRIKISYSILNNASKFKYFKPCVKRYLNSNIDSKLIYIDPKEWDAALFLPLQRFKKSSTAKVYSDSRKIINKG